MALPAEILRKIFSHLIPRYLYYCSLVCRDWHRATKHLLYNTVHIYRKRQLETFLVSCQVRSKDNLSYGELVQYVYFHRHMRVEELDSNTWWLFQSVCPNVRSLNTAVAPNKATTERDLRVLPGWRHFTHLPDWYADEFMTWNKVLGEQLEYRSLSQISTTEWARTNFNDGLKLGNLVELSVTFLLGVAPQLSESFLNFLPNVCPSLKTLTLANFSLTKSNAPDNNPETIITPITSVTSVTCKNIVNIDSFVYEYLGHTFPCLQSLELDVSLSSSQTSVWTEGQKSAFYKMIKRWQLRSLKFSVSNHYILFATLVPQFLLAWFLSNSQNLTTLRWNTFGFNEPDAIQQRPQLFARFSCLTSLDLTLCENFNCHNLLQLFLENHETSTPNHLKNLTLRGDRPPAADERDNFDFCIWMEVCPRLTELRLCNMNVKHNQQGINAIDGNVQGKKACFFQLETLDIQCSHIYPDGALTSLLKHCPQLSTLKCNDVTISYDQAPGFSSQLPLIMLDASHLKLDLVDLSNMRAKQSESSKWLPIQVALVLEVSATKLAMPGAMYSGSGCFDWGILQIFCSAMGRFIFAS